jgi:hypothetical protein
MWNVEWQSGGLFWLGALYFQFSIFNFSFPLGVHMSAGGANVECEILNGE